MTPSVYESVAQERVVRGEWAFWDALWQLWHYRLYSDLVTGLVMKTMHMPVCFTISCIKQHESSWNEHRLRFHKVCIINSVCKICYFFVSTSSILESVHPSGGVSPCPHHLPVQNQLTSAINKEWAPTLNYSFFCQDSPFDLLRLL